MADFPTTPAIRELRAAKVVFEPFLYEYVDKGGTRHSADALGVDEHAIVKTLVFETNDKKPLIVLQHGDRQVSAKELARVINVKSVAPAAPDRANRLTGYLVGGTSPFGVRTKMPVYAESTIFELDRIWINGGKRGFLIAIDTAELGRILAAVPVSVAIV
jgi:Cys-tRNA(Pro) deacylase